MSDGLGVAHAVPEQLLHPRPALAEDAEPRQPRPRSCSVAPVIRHHALTLVLLHTQVIRLTSAMRKRTIAKKAPTSILVEITFKRYHI